MNEFLAFTRTACLIHPSLKQFNSRKLRISEIVWFKPKSSIEQQFWNIRHKALIEVKKITLFISSHNSRSVWEWTQKIIPSLKELHSQFFEISIFLAYLLWFLAPKDLSQSGWKGKTMLKSLKRGCHHPSNNLKRGCHHPSNNLKYFGESPKIRFHSFVV